LVLVETKVIDFQWKGCIIEQKCKNNVSRKEELGMGLFSTPISPRYQRDEN